MKKNNWQKYAGHFAAALLSSLLLACGGGDTGPTGPAGPQGPQGPGPGVIQIPSNSTPATDAAAAAWAALSPQVTVTAVTIASPPVVSFKVTDSAGHPVIGLGNTSKSSTATLPGLTNLSFSIAKLVPGTNGNAAKWVSYIVTTVPTTSAPNAAPTRPTTDNTGTLVDNKDGTYTYTFYRDITKIKADVEAMTVAAPNNKADLGDLSFEPNLVHRLTIQLSGNAPGTGTNTPTGVEVAGKPGVPMTAPVDVIHDFVPATGQKAPESGRDIVANGKCVECHQQLGGIPGDSSESSGASFHGGNRNNVQYCVVCHTEQRKYGKVEATINSSNLTFTSKSTDVVDGRAVGNLPNFIHKIHSGKFLAKQNYNYAGVLPNEVGYPQDIRNCTKCHDGSPASSAQTVQGDNWKGVPSRLACGSCHDGINFATGTGVTLADAANGLTSSVNAHPAGPQTDDAMCSTCHKSSSVDLVHTPVTPPNPKNSLLVAGGSSNTNAAWIASNANRLPAGAIKVSYEIKSVSRNASKQPTMVFRMLQNGARADLNVFDPTKPVATQELWPNFFGAPSAYFVFAVPQDGITAPSDFNASVSGYLRNIWNGKATGTGAGTLTGPDADGFYTVTLTGVTIPDSAVMLTGGVGYSYSLSNAQPLAQSNVEGYPATPSTVASPPANQPNLTGGLIVIAPNVQKVATGYTGRRAIVEDKRCNACHQELGTFTEDAFHSGQRNDGSTCSWCHTPNRASSGWSADSASFVHAIHAGNKRDVPFTWHAASTTESFANIGYPGVLKQCEACHLPGTYDFSVAASAAAAPNRQYRTVASGTINASDPLAVFSLSPYIVNGTNYGAGFSFNAGTGATTVAAGTTLTISPTATACFACHDSVQSVAHMKQNGGSIYAARTTALATMETCSICHAPGRVGDIKAVHAR